MRDRPLLALCGRLLGLAAGITVGVLALPIIAGWTVAHRPTRKDPGCSAT